MFTDAISDHPVDDNTALRLGSIMRMELADTGTQAGASAQLKEYADREAPVVELLDQATLADPNAAPAAPAAPQHTQETLEEVADKNGIAGLRAIAEPLGLKGRGIGELIKEILNDQAVKAATADPAAVAAAEAAALEAAAATAAAAAAAADEAEKAE